MKYKKSIDSINEIIQIAINEFAQFGYDESSISRICQNTNLTKGKIYHHFKSKDELFIACIEQCFQELTQYLKSCSFNGDIENALISYFDARQNFFKRNPNYMKIFFIATVTPPPHLSNLILDIKKEFDNFNFNFISQLLSNEKLNGKFTLNEAIEAFSLFQDYFNTIGKNKQINLANETESIIQKRIHFFLHGILG